MSKGDNYIPIKQDNSNNQTVAERIKNIFNQDNSNNWTVAERMAITRMVIREH